MNDDSLNNIAINKNDMKQDDEELYLQELDKFGQIRIDNWDNTLIIGDNLKVLEILSNNKDIRNNVRLVYIDPPFATNQDFKYSSIRTSTISKSKDDSIAYKDRKTGHLYLDFLRKRLVLLRELLANNGVIYVHIDCKVGHYVKILMDEVFGKDKFINDITRIKCNPKNFNRKGYGNIKDMILFYSKTDDFIWDDPREVITEKDIIILFPKIDDNGRRYTTTPLHAPGETLNGPTGQIWKGQKPPTGRHWRYHPDVMTKLDEQGLIEWSSTGNPRKKIFADDALNKGKKRQDIWEFKDPAFPDYPTQKNLNMLKVIINANTKPDDIVLDSFIGSGTTSLAAEELNRRWIGIDNSEVAIEIAKRRILSKKNTNSFIICKLSKKISHECLDQEKH